MIKTLSRILGQFVIAASLVGAAQAQVETVVVTGERMTSESEAPHIGIPKRADHLITVIDVVCDTRDATQRRAELKETLGNLLRAASGTSTISIGLGEHILGDLTENNFDSIIEAETRADTSHAEVTVKTKVTKDDTINDAMRRVTGFLDKVPKAGRTLIARQGSWGLTLIGPEQYHDQLVAMILADAKHLAETLGPGYGVTIEGMERKVTWYQRGPLDLGLFIPYTLKIEPVGAKTGS
ncbi:MAG TPA: hypothetical protein VG387_10060 [Rhizomicrobium sp.]|jgi:hypothetical protein|nr:hypothetical protein [Rhizomicrobium sp.]